MKFCPRNFWMTPIADIYNLILPTFDHPPTYMDKIFTLELDKIWKILDHPPTPSCPCSYWMAPKCNHCNIYMLHTCCRDHCEDNQCSLQGLRYSALLLSKMGKFAIWQKMTVIWELKNQPKVFLQKFLTLQN